MSHSDTAEIIAAPLAAAALHLYASRRHAHFLRCFFADAEASSRECYFDSFHITPYASLVYYAADSAMTLRCD